MYGHRLHPQIRMASLPMGQPAVQVGERPAIAFRVRHPVITRGVSPADDHLEGSVTQPGLLDGGAQQYAVARRLVRLDEDPLRGPVRVVVAESNDRDGAPRR